MFHSVSLFVVLYLFWLLLSGFFTAFLLSAGAGSALAVVWFARRMDLVDGEGHPIHLGPKALLYWPWLVKEIVKSAWDVSKIIVHPELADQSDAGALQAESADRRGSGHPRQLDHPDARHDHDRSVAGTNFWCTASRAAAPKARWAVKWTAE